MKVRDILHPDVPTVSPTETATAAWEIMNALATDHLVVTRDGGVVGVVSRPDLGGPSGGAHRRMGRRIADLMRRDFVTVTPGTSVRKAASLMRRHGLACLPVLERKKLAGMVTIRDMLALLERQLAD